MAPARVLIIEDDRSLAEVLAYNLKQAGYEVDQGVIDRGAKHMTERLPEMDDVRTRAYALFALALS